MLIHQITTTQITVDKFIKQFWCGLGQTTTAGRDVGIGTAIGTIIYNEITERVELYKRYSGWKNICWRF